MVLASSACCCTTEVHNSIVKVFGTISRFPCSCLGRVLSEPAARTLVDAWEKIPLIGRIIGTSTVPASWGTQGNNLSTATVIVLTGLHLTRVKSKPRTCHSIWVIEGEGSYSVAACIRRGSRRRSGWSCRRGSRYRGRLRASWNGRTCGWFDTLCWVHARFLARVCTRGHTGTITGHFAWDTTGVSTGLRTGLITGLRTGLLTGTVTGNLTRTITGLCTRLLAGAVTGFGTGLLTGTVTGNLTRAITGINTWKKTGGITRGSGWSQSGERRRLGGRRSCGLSGGTTCKLYVFGVKKSVYFEPQIVENYADTHTYTCIHTHSTYRHLRQVLESALGLVQN